MEGREPQGSAFKDGQVFRISNILLKANIIPMYHPAAAVHNADMLPILKDDFRKVKAI